MASVDTSRLIVGNDGHTSFSGLGSGIDFQAAVDAMVKAKRIPIDKLSDSITKNNDKIKAYTDLSTKLSAVREAINKLRGAISADRSTNIFMNKESFASSLRDTSLLYNPNRTSASAAASLVGVTVTNAAERGSYTLEVLRTARAQKDSSQLLQSTYQQDRSDAISSDNTALDSIIPGFAGGTITINGQSITLDADDTLDEVRTKINGTANVGVTATIVNAGPGDYRLTLTSNTRATAITYGDDAVNDTLSLLGVLDGSDAVKNEVQAGVAGNTGALNKLIPGFAGGTFSIFGHDVSIDATSTLLDVRDRINAANTGVTATILTASSSDFYLVLTNSDTGEVIEYSDPADVLAGLGVLNNDDSVKNQLQASQTAQFTANGLRDTSRKRSDIVYNPGTNFATLAPGLVTAGAQSFQISSGGVPFTVNYDDTMNLNQLMSAINAAASLAGSDVTATLETVEGGNGGYRLIVKDASGDAVTFANDTGGLVTALNFTDPRVLERSSNTVNDLIPGMTINLFQAEGGTTIKIDVDQNLSDVKTQIANFVAAYNELVRFMNQQISVDPVTGQPTEDSGVLFGSNTIADVKSKIGVALSTAIAGVSTDFAVLGNIGVKFVNNNQVTDPLDYNTMTIDEAKLDEALLNNAENVRKLFTFDGSTNDSRFTITGFEGSMEYAASGVSINFTHDGTGFTSADIGGDSSAIEIVNGNTLKIKSGPGKGMILYYSGGASTGTMQANYTVGVAAKMFTQLETLLTTDTGTVDVEVKTLKNLNKTAQERIDMMTVRLETFRQQQLEKFYKMETAMSRSKNILDQITQSTRAQNSDN